MNIRKREVEMWNGSHDGIDFEINSFLDYEGKKKWTYYLILKLDRIPKESCPDSFWLKGEKKRYNWIDYKYMSTIPICNIEFHGGITYYSKLAGFDGAGKVIKIGCDYSHYWDDGLYYDLESIKNDVLNSIESFKSLVPKYKYWCQGNGKLYDLEEGKLKNGSFLSNEYKNRD